MEEAGVNGSLGLLDTQDMWQGVAGDKQEAVQGVHTYTLPPEQEVALLLDQPPIISFQQPVFLRHLPSLHTSAHLSDTVIVTHSGAQLPCHSLVLAAASSMMKHVFEEVQDKLMDTQFTILMPDYTLEEVADFLKSVYGTEVVSLSNPLAIDFNIGDINSNVPKAASEQVTSNPELVYQQERPEETSLNSYVGHSILDKEPPEPRNSLKRKRGRPKKTKHGYLNDDFIDDHEDGEWNVARHLIEEKEEKTKKKRGRPKKVKEEDELEKLEELEHYDELEEMEETILEPVVKVKEEEIERNFHEFNEFFSAPAANTAETQISFNQDDTGLFQCEAPGCDFSTFVRASIQQHVRQTHSGVGYQAPTQRCPSCGEDWANELHFSRHVTSNECSVLRGQDKPYVCEACGEGWYNLTSLTRHIESGACRTAPPLVMGSKIKCLSCDLTFFSLKNREVHVKKAHLPPEETSYRCARCDMNFVTHKEFNVHKKAIHGSELRAKFQCRIVGCGFETDKRDVIAEHTKYQHRDCVHICSDCGRNFVDNQKLLQHHASHARSGRGRKCLPAIYPCPQCPREFNRKRHMELHMLFKHSTDRPYSCQECGKKFKTRHCVNIHLRSHGIGGYSWCCEECGKTFNQISAYHVHLKVHSNVRDFACEDCGMTFKLKHSLKKHQLVHKTEFGHTCDFCGKKFKRSDNLINHRRRHTGEHPYKCDKCSWTGPDSSSFIHHKKKHSEPVTNVHQDTKHGPFTNISQVDFKPQVLPSPGSPGASGQEELKPIITSTVLHSAAGQEIKLLHTIQPFKHP